MNQFQGILSGGAELKDTYPSAAYEALKKRKAKLRESLANRASGVGKMEANLDAKPKGAVRPKKVF